jgi:threonine synthase
MTAASEDNVRCLAIGGDFDDCQAIVKAMFADRAFVDAVSLSGVNSINWARILAQSVYYFTSAVALGAPDRAVAFAVPTGNFGDAFAADVARRMGLPIKTIVVATNANDIMARVFETGRYERGRVVETQSPAMDIQVASNFERLYFEILDRDPSATAKAFLEVSEGRGVLIPGKALEGLQSDFTSRAISEGQTSDTMASALQSYDALIDPHTAVALCAASGEGGAGGEIGAPMVVLSTAHPAKFPEAVQAATGRAAPLPAHAHDLFDRKERFDRLPCDLEAVKRYVRAFAARSAP